MNRLFFAVAFGCWVSAIGLSPACSQDSAATQKNYLSNEFVPDDATAVVIASPAGMLTSPAMEMLPIEIVQAQMLELVGVDPLHINQAKLVLGMPGPNGPQAGLVLKLNQDYAVGDLKPEIFLDTEPHELSGLSVYPIDGPPGTVLFRKDARTFFVSTGGYLSFMLEANDGAGPLPTLLKKVPNKGGLTAVMVMQQIEPMLTGFLRQGADEMPPQLQPLTSLPKLTNALVINANLQGAMSAETTIVALCQDESAAVEMESILNNAIDFGRDQVLQQASQNTNEGDAIQQATTQYMIRVSTKLTDMLRPSRQGSRLTIHTDGQVGTMGVLAGLMLPAIQSARSAAQRMSSSNNLKQIGLAFHNHHDAFRQLPEPAIRDAAGKPLLSWRVKILPFIEENALYEQFHLDEPWDSEHNLTLIQQMPAIYEHPALPLAPGTTVYQVPAGEGLMFNQNGPTRFRDVLDGTSNTIMAFEANAEAAVQWTKPADTPIDMNDPLSAVNELPTGGFQALFGDGSVRVIQTFDIDTLRALFTRAGGEVINGGF